MATQRQIGFGAKAYQLRRLTGMKWPDIADRLGYRPEWKRAVRAHRLMILAKAYADPHGLGWPPRSRAKAE